MFQPDIESATRDEREAQQFERLRDLVGRLATSPSPLHRERLAGVEAGDLDDLDDVASLPFMTKEDFHAAYPWGLLAVPREDTVRVHASSGTSGKPKIVAYTRRDIATWADVCARSVVCAGGQADDILHVAYGYGLFTGGLGLHYGGEALGATVIPASGGNAQLQLQLLGDLGAAGIAATPSFTMLLAERALAEGVRDIRLRYGILGAEPWSNAFRDKLQAAWAEVTGHEFVARDIYGLTEIMGPGVAMECVENPGSMHIFDDHFLPEIIDRDTGAPLSEGERGELVITALTKEALPVLRYRTGDVTTLHTDPCPCGRTHARIGRIEGRTDDMLIVRGVNVFPREIEAVVLDETALNGAYVIVVDQRGTMAELEVRAEIEASAWHQREEITSRLRQRLSDRLRIRPTVRVEESGALPRTQVGKIKRVYVRTADEDPVPSR